MLLDLKKILDIPGASAPFECELSEEGLDFPSVRGYVRAPSAHGRVFNEAGMIRMQGEIEAEMICICDRCGEEFRSTKRTEVDAVLAQEESEDNPELFLIEGDAVDVDEVLYNCFVLDMETKFLCSEDCKGLCPVCGSNRNLSDCGCPEPGLDNAFAILKNEF